MMLYFLVTEHCAACQNSSRLRFMFKRCCLSCNTSARSCFWSRTNCCASRNCTSRKSNSFCACRAAYRDLGDSVNTSNLERSLEDISSSLATFSLLILSDCMQSLIARVSTHRRIDMSSAGTTDSTTAAGASLVIAGAGASF